jgi:hypothetical protein
VRIVGSSKKMGLLTGEMVWESQSPVVGGGVGGRAGVVVPARAVEEARAAVAAAARMDESVAVMMEIYRGRRAGCAAWVGEDCADPGVEEGWA